MVQDTTGSTGSTCHAFWTAEGPTQVSLRPATSGAGHEALSQQLTTPADDAANPRALRLHPILG